MQLDKDTIQKLKNFSVINSNLVYSGQGKLKTISEAKNILAETDIAIDKPFSIYDLNEFLSTLSLFENGDVTFNDDAIVIKEGRKKLKYVFADPNILTTPQKDITMPPAEFDFCLSAEDISQIQKAASTLGHNVLQIRMDKSNTVTIAVIDSTNSSKNEYSWTYETGDVYQESLRFSFDILINNLKLIPDNYSVKLSSKLISKWEGSTTSYYIALEGTSKYGNS